MRQYEKAIDAGERSTEFDPNGAMVHALLGQNLNYAGRPDEGIVYLNKAIRLNPLPAYWYYSHLGLCYLQKGQYENALTELKKALQRAPEAPSSYYRLSIAYTLLGREEEARASAAKSLELRPSISVSMASKRWPYKNKAFIKIILDAMRKAGFPE